MSGMCAGVDLLGSRCTLPAGHEPDDHKSRTMGWPSITPEGWVQGPKFKWTAYSDRDKGGELDALVLRLRDELAETKAAT